jgi:acetyl/propionyl-CoA carboxylase alpha subunit
VLGDAQGSLHIRAFYDLLCNSMCYAGIDSKKSNSNIREALQTHGINGIKLTINFFPLPYHIYSFKVHQGYQYIKRIMGNNVANKYVQYVLNNQAAYYESKWTSNTIGEFLDSFTKDIKSILVTAILFSQSTRENSGKR